MKPKKQKKRKNSNYQVGFNSAVKLLFEYEYLRKQPAYICLLDLEAQSKEVGEFIRYVFVQLKEYTGGIIPDHMAFREKLYGYLSDERKTDAMHYKSFTHGAMQDKPTNDNALLMIVAAYYGAMKSMDLDFEQEADEQNKQAMAVKLSPVRNRWKLLQGLYDDWDRLFAALKAMTTELSLSEDSILEFGEEIPSPQDLMIRLSYALNKDLKNAADRLVGMLQMVKNKLDPGEYAYFSAMVYMKESDVSSLDKAYKELSKIPKEAAEYGTSRGMLAEVLARKGNPKGFLEVFDHTGYIGHLAMLGYVQQLILNMQFPSFDETNRKQVQQTESMQQLQQVIHKLAECYPNVLEISRDAPEYFCYLNNVLEASEEIYRFYQDLPYVEQDVMTAPGTVARAATLLQITATPYKEGLERLLCENTKENRLKFVMDYFNFPMKSGVTAFSPRLDLMLKAARTFLLGEEFVDSFLQNYKVYEKIFDKKLLQQWLTEAYFVALSCEDSRQSELRKKLDALCPEQDTTFEEDVTYRTVWGMLTGPGRLLYTSAETSYRAARDSDYGWKDAGMLSLGFFRLVEVELRQRLLVDVFGNKDPDVRQWHRELKVYCEQTPDDDRLGVFTVGKEKYDLARTLIALRQPKKLTMEQMEYCFYLLSEQAEMAPEWNMYRDKLREKFYSVLSAEGIQASKDGRIAQAISQQKRMEYRNPPAHARYLPIEKATECRDYVNQTITTLWKDWLITQPT